MEIFKSTSQEALLLPPLEFPQAVNGVISRSVAGEELLIKINYDGKKPGDKIGMPICFYPLSYPVQQSNSGWLFDIRSEGEEILTGFMKHFEGVKKTGVVIFYYLPDIMSGDVSKIQHSQPTVISFCD